MAVEYQNKSEVKNTGTSITIPIPTGWSAGDLLIAYVTKDDDNTITPPAGWTQLHDVAGGTAMNLWVGWRIAQTGDTEWTWTGDSEDYYGVILRYTGHDPTTPIHASGVATGETINPTAPSVAFGDPTPLTAGSLVLQVFGADDDDIPYNVPSPLESRFNDSATTTGGAGGDREAPASHWLSPTGFVDFFAKWNAEENAYDGNTGTYTVVNLGIPASSWSSPLEFTIAAISCSKVRTFADYLAGIITQISVDVYYSDAWHNIFEGNFSGYDQQWMEHDIGSTQTVTAMRIKLYNSSGSTSFAGKLYEVSFWRIETATDSTGTAIFTMNAIEEWVAVTMVIEAAVSAGYQYLLSTATIATSITSSLSRGVTEALNSTATIASSITGSLTRGINQVLNSASAIASSITGLLSRGVTEALTSTSAITTSITGRIRRIVDLVSTSAIVTSITSLLTRGIALLSTSNIVTSITGSLSRGTTEVLTSTSNIATSITSGLSRGITQTLVSASNIATSITSALSRGVTQVLTSTANGVVSITGSLSRGVKELLTSTSNIAVSIIANLTKQAGETIYLLSTAIITSSITSSLSRGIKETLASTVDIVTGFSAKLTRIIGLTSTSAIVVSITSSLSRGVKETLTSISVIATSITSSLSRGITKTLTSVTNIATSITSSLSRGVTEALTSTVNIATSISGILSRGITQALISTSNIVISTTSSLGRGIKETLMSTVNIVTSIIGVLSKVGVIALNSVAAIVCFIGGEIDIGSPAINRASFLGSDYTYVDKNNPANYSGEITSVEIWANENLVDCEVATFYIVSGSNLSTRDYEYIGSVTAGSKQTFPVNLNVQEGDFLGIKFSAGQIEKTDSGLNYFKWGDSIPCTNVLFSNGSDTISLYGTGTGGVFLGRGIKETLTSTANIAVSIIAELSDIGKVFLNSTAIITTSIMAILSRGIKETLESTVNIVTSITSVLSKGIVQALTSTSVIMTSMSGNLSRGIKEALTTIVNISTSITSTLSSGILKTLNSTVNIVSSITATLKAIYHWAKVTKEKADWTKVSKEKEDWILVSKEKGDSTKVSKSKDDWIKVIKEKGDISKVEKE